MPTAACALRVFAIVFGLGVSLVPGQTPKQPLTQRDFDRWRSISGQQLSRDGRWLAYAYMPQDGDGELVVRELATGKEYRESAGALPPPLIVNPAEANPEAEPPRRTLTLRFTSDGQFLVASYFPSKADADVAKRQRKRPDDMPKGGLLTMKLADGGVARMAGIRNFQVPEKGGAWVAFLKEPAPEQRKPAVDATTADEDQRGRPPIGTSAAGGTSSRADYGTDLILRDLARGVASDKTFANALEYVFARDGKTLAYAVGSRKPEENGLFAVTPGSDANRLALLSGKGKYTRLAWDREQSQMAFLASKDDAETKPPRFKVYHWDRRSGAAAELVESNTAGFPVSLVVSDRGTLGFSRDGKKLYLGAGKPDKPDADAAPAAGSAAAASVLDDKVQLDVWHWHDDLVQPMQRVRANQERIRTYRGVYHIAEKRFVQIGSESVPTVTFSGDGKQALGTDDRAYRRMIDYDGSYSDYYWIDTMSGEKKQIVKQMRAGGPSGNAMQWSPDGKYALYFNDRNWHMLTASNASIRNLTGGLSVTFANEEDDTPGPPGSNGSAGWSKDSTSALLYDRYDVWRFFADGRAPVNLTDGAGRRDKIAYRVQRTDPFDEDDDEPGIDLAKPLTLRAVAEETRDSGFFRLRPGSSNPERLLWGPRNYAFAGRAKDADVLLITASRFDEFPDLQVTDGNFANAKKVTSGGAQLAPYTWGAAETVRYRNTDGVPLKATLYKPENFDAAKKYPMLVYIYERLSQNVHGFVTPQPGHSINVALYVSNGYLVLMPDIVYTLGYPGQSALKCVLPAIDAVVDKGFVKEDSIGIQGHSWGGYQIAYMITQTQRFKAAEAGAPVGNMTSAYSGIRWGPGMPRQFQYEQGQSRIGVPLYKNPQRYIENSPIFHVERVKTPLLILHNDQDDAVPWYQGIELFLALRRNDKEAYLLSYNGEFHGLRRRQNQKDYSARMQQFFDYHLKGAPKPEWMEKGVSFLDRDAEKETFRKVYSEER